MTHQKAPPATSPLQPRLIGAVIPTFHNPSESTSPHRIARVCGTNCAIFSCTKHPLVDQGGMVLAYPPKETKFKDCAALEAALGWLHLKDKFCFHPRGQEPLSGTDQGVCFFVVKRVPAPAGEKPKSPESKIGVYVPPHRRVKSAISRPAGVYVPFTPSSVSAIQTARFLAAQSMSSFETGY